MRDAIEDVRQQFGGLHGIVHAAGIAGGGVIQRKTVEAATRVLAPKVRGTLALAPAIGAASLDFVALCSSINAIVGGPGSVDYTAANAFMDGLAIHRRRRGLAATSINWGPWAETGMAAELETDRFAAQGIRPLAPAAGLGAMGRLLDEMPAQAVVAAIDWAAYGRSHGLDGTGGLFASLVDTPEHRAAEATDEPATLDILAELADTLPAQREGVMRAYLQELARQTLGYGQGEAIATDRATKP